MCQPRSEGVWGVQGGNGEVAFQVQEDNVVGGLVGRELEAGPGFSSYAESKPNFQAALFSLDLCHLINKPFGTAAISLG